MYVSPFGGSSPSAVQALCRLFVVFLLSTVSFGCAGKTPFSEAQVLSLSGDLDAAVAKYAEAAKADPENEEYRIALISAREKAALMHIDLGRKRVAEGDLGGGSGDFRRAIDLDPSNETALRELKEVSRMVRATDLTREAENLFYQGKYQQARERLEEALSLNPKERKAQEIASEIEKQSVPPLKGFELALTSDEPISLQFKSTSVSNIFKILSNLSGIKFILDDAVGNKQISIDLDKATFAQALELVLKMTELNRKVLNPWTILIYPDSKIPQYDDHIIRVFYLSHIEAKKAVNLLRSLLQARKVHVHEGLNALVVRDRPEVITLAEQLIKAVDRGDSEVAFDLELVEVSHGDDFRFGPKLSPYSVSVGAGNDGKIVSSTLQAGDDTSGLVSGLSNLDTFYTLPTATFDFLKTLSDSEILANPKIRVKNKGKAKVHVGTREPVITVTTTNETTSDNIQYVDVGVKLDVEPVVQLDQTVVTKLSLEVSSVSERQVTANGSVALTITTTNAQTNLTLKDGERTIIGGLIRDNQTRTRSSIPFLGSIPILGALFTSYEDVKDKRELLLSITPHIVKPMDHPGPDVGSIWSGGEKKLKAGPSFESFSKARKKLEPKAFPASSISAPKKSTFKKAKKGKAQTAKSVKVTPRSKRAINGALRPVGIVTFEKGQTTIRAEFHPLLKKVAGLAKADKAGRVLIEGHTDKLGEAENNLRFSRQRAESAARYLTGIFGVDEERITIKGYGGTRPRASNDTPEGRKRNRRVELKIFK